MVLLDITNANSAEHGRFVTPMLPRALLRPALPKVELTAAAVERFKAEPGTRIEYFGKLLPGFALRVSGPSPSSPAGSKSWVVFYRFGGRLRRDTIGKWPVLDLGEAREKARKLLGAVSENRDPHSAMQVAHSLDSAVDEFMKRHMTARQRSTSCINETRRIFNTLVLPGCREEPSRTSPGKMCSTCSTESPTVGHHRERWARRPRSWQIGPWPPSGCSLGGRLVAGLSMLVQYRTCPGQLPKTLAIARFQTMRSSPFGRGARPSDGRSAPYSGSCFLTAQHRDEVGSMSWAEVDMESGLVDATA
jgi:hypothetical protein